MDMTLTDEEIRVLGCLLEKELATPDYYPLSLNALNNACNQKSNRHPVVSYDEATVIRALDRLRERKLIRQSNIGRVTKYEQVLSGEMNLVAAEQAILAILLVRGPQTVGEIRTRTERLHAFADLDEVQASIANLEGIGLVVRQARQPGRKESRYAQLFGGEVAVPAEEPGGRFDTGAADEHRDDLRLQIEDLRRELHELQQEFRTFRSQFD